LGVILWWPLRLDVSGRARGEADGGWVVAGGASLAALSMAVVWARGESPQLSFMIFGRKLSRLSGRIARPAKTEVASGRAEPTLPSRLWRRIDPLSLSLKVLDERRFIRVRYLVVDLTYGFRDPLLTGKLAGALSALSAVLPRPIEIRQAPRWNFEDGWEISLEGRAVLRPWLALLDVAGYVVRQLISHERKQDRRGGREPAPRGAGHFEERDDHRGAPGGG
jgi:hypothetical protein